MSRDKAQNLCGCDLCGFNPCLFFQSFSLFANVWRIFPIWWSTKHYGNHQQTILYDPVCSCKDLKGITCHIKIPFFEATHLVSSRLPWYRGLESWPPKFQKKTSSDQSRKGKGYVLQRKRTHHHPNHPFLGSALCFHQEVPTSLHFMRFWPIHGGGTSTTQMAGPFVAQVWANVSTLSRTESRH